MINKHICFYISDHGFGHAMRCVPIMEELLSHRKRYAEEIRITAVCGERQIPVIRSCLSDEGIVYRIEHMDVGLILRSGTLQVDPDRLLTEAKEYLSHRHQRAVKEAAWLVQNEVDIAVY